MNKKINEIFNRNETIIKDSDNLKQKLNNLEEKNLEKDEFINKSNLEGQALNNMIKHLNEKLVDFSNKKYEYKSMSLKKESSKLIIN